MVKSNMKKESTITAEIKPKRAPPLSQRTEMKNVFRYKHTCSFTGIPCGSNCNVCTVPLWPEDIVKMATTVYTIAKTTERRRDRGH